MITLVILILFPHCSPLKYQQDCVCNWWSPSLGMGGRGGLASGIGAVKCKTVFSDCPARPAVVQEWRLRQRLPGQKFTLVIKSMRETVTTLRVGCFLPKSQKWNLKRRRKQNKKQGLDYSKQCKENDYVSYFINFTIVLKLCSLLLIQEILLCAFSNCACMCVFFRTTAKLNHYLIYRFLGVQVMHFSPNFKDTMDVKKMLTKILLQRTEYFQPQIKGMKETILQHFKYIRMLFLEF